MPHLVLLFQGAQNNAITAYIPVLLFLIIAIAIPVVALGAARFLRRRVFEREKLMPYECGIDPVRDAKERFSIRYYVVAMLFLVPWAVTYDRLAIFGLIEMLTFIGILVVGYYWAWRKGALEWV